MGEETRLQRRTLIPLEIQMCTHGSLTLYGFSHARRSAPGWLPTPHTSLSAVPLSAPPLQLGDAGMDLLHQGLELRNALWAVGPPPAVVVMLTGVAPYTQAMHALVQYSRQAARVPPKVKPLAKVGRRDSRARLVQVIEPAPERSKDKSGFVGLERGGLRGYGSLLVWVENGHTPVSRASVLRASQFQQSSGAALRQRHC